jgi:low molecular weight protein-tyrosine phosphatase
MSSAEFHVLFVCTGNRFRSPLAAELFRVHVAGLPVVVSSAGTLDLVAGPAEPEALEQGLLLGVDLSSHRSRCLGDEDLSTVDLVIGFEPAHVARAVVDAKAPRERTFMLAELVELLELDSEEADSGSPIDRARAAVARADLLRVRSGSPAGAHEIADPYGAGAEVARQTAQAIRSLTNRLADGLFRT